MAEELAALIENLTAQLEEQRLQIAALQENRRASEEEAHDSPATAAVSAAAATSSFPKIPDLIRIIPEFNGNPRDLPRWIESVEEKLTESKRYVPEDEIPRVMPIWLGIIRDKIKEKANDALSASHVALDWKAMKNTLVEYFGDKSDLSTLVYKMTSLRQGSLSVIEFFHLCRSLLAEINAKIIINNTPNEAKAIMGTYETLMTNAFVDGLHDSTSDLTRSTRPQSLAAAYQVASEHEAAIQRRRERNKKQTLDDLKTKIVSNVNPMQQRRPFAFPPAMPPRPFFSQIPPLRPFASNQTTQHRPPQRFPQQNFNNTSQQNAPFAIKQEPRSQVGFKSTFRQRPINFHEQPYDFPDYPPHCGMQQYEFNPDDNCENGQENQQYTTEESFPAPTFSHEEEATNHDVNFSVESESNQQT